MRLAATTAVLLLGLAGCASKPLSKAGPEDSASSLKPASKRNPAPGFTLKDVDGKPVTLADFKGKVVLLNFWATWCGPCKIEIPWFKDFQKTYKDQGFTVIGVALDDEGWEVVKPYITDKQVNYPVVIGTPEVEQLYGSVEALPTTFIIDRDGKIASVHVGLVGKKDYENEIQQLLQ
ncbi:MAG: redoxin domain-containing protein [Acidobacteria bacterium]|nr:redoxin domain-containing protein [Acidobacteriota bacterium]